MSLLDEIRDLLTVSAQAYQDRPAHPRLLEAAAHLDAPLHVAVAGLPGSGRRRVLTALSTDPALVAHHADQPGPVDAVLYAFRETYPTGVNFARMLADLAHAGAGPVRTVGVLTAVDITDGNDQPMRRAGEWVATLSGQPALRAMIAEVVPLAGLVAAAAITLRQGEYDMLAQLAGEGPTGTDPLLMPAQQLAQHAGPTVLPWLGFYGVRAALRLLHDDAAMGTAALSMALASESGLNRLREVLEHRFHARLPVLRAEQALRLVAEVTRADPLYTAADLRRHVEQIRCDTHELAELDALASGSLPERLSRVLGGRGTSVAARIGDGSLVVERDHWDQVAQHPLTEPVTARAAAVAVRSCELLVTAA